jgi:putative transposase
MAPGGVVYHVLNRSVRQDRIFDDDGDYLAFEEVLCQAHERTGMPLLAYCIMPNHWHLVVRPRKEGELSQYMRWLTVTHTQRWHASRGSAGSRPLYQGRFRSFPVQEDDHFLLLCQYVERNPVRAGLVTRATAWRWSSAGGGREAKPWLTSREQWPVPAPADWVKWLGASGDRAELEAMRRSVIRGAPFGDDRWTTRTARRLSLQSSLRAPHRPKAVGKKDLPTKDPK